MPRSLYWYQVICRCDLSIWKWPSSEKLVFHKNNFVYRDTKAVNDAVQLVVATYQNDKDKS